MFFVYDDTELSDAVGFQYSQDTNPADSVEDFMDILYRKYTLFKDEAGDPRLSTMGLDGENAWEYYPENGYHFLSALYEVLADNSAIKLTTYSEYLKTHNERSVLNNIVAGSWVYGTFSTWIGEKDKNRAWDMLVEAKNTYDKVVSSGTLDDESYRNATLQLATCESSDWFWWLGEYNSAESVAMFDELFRLHLSNLYQLLEVESPDYLTRVFSVGTGAPAMGGAMRPGRQE